MWWTMCNKVTGWLAFVVLCQMVVGCGRDSLEDLIARLGDPDFRVRRAAATKLVERAATDEHVVPALMPCVADHNIEARRLAIDVLGQIGPGASASLPTLKAALADQEPTVRMRAAIAIQRIAPEERSFVPVLVSAMRAGQGRILLHVGAMGADGAWAVPTLMELLSHDSPQMRALAAQTLGRVGLPASDARAALERAARDPNAAVQSAARGAMQRIQGKSEEARTQAEL
jgi:HEAT repeat protein